MMLRLSKEFRRAPSLPNPSSREPRRSRPSSGFALAGASSRNIPPPIDPTAKNLTPYMISLRAFDACLIVQSRLQGMTREAVHSPCSCYAKLTIKNMTKEEFDAFRATGYFDESARQKALEALDACKLPRPPLS